MDRGYSRTLLVVALLMASIVPLPLLLAEPAAEPVYDSNLDLVARRTSTAPVIDGTIDPVWADAIVLGTFATGNSGNFDINMRAMFDDDYIYILAEWKEFNPPNPPKEDADRDAWELVSNSSSGVWDHKDWGVDRLSFFFEDPDAPVQNFSTQGCDAICHDLTEMHTMNPGEQLDAWEWSAATTNQQSYADDGSLQNNNTVTIDPQTMHVTLADLAWDEGADGWWVNNDTANATERPTHVWKPGAMPSDPRFMWLSDAEGVDWDTFDAATIPQGEMIPGHILMTPDGDRADVEAKGVHDGTNWTVEFKRLRDTGSSYDVAFDDTNVPYYFSPAVTNNMTGDNHAKGITAYRIWLAEPEMPDLAVRSILPLTTSPAVNSTLNVGAVIENIGWADAGASQLSAYWDETGAPAPVMVAVPAIPWGEYRSLNFNVSTQGLPAGNNTLVIVADAGDAVSEINETNNDNTREVELGDEVLPNWNVGDLSMDPGELTPDAYTEVSVSIVNDGATPTPQASIVLYLDDIGDPITTDTLPVIDDGDSWLWQYTWGPVTLPEGAYTLNVTVDPADEVKETSEADNSASLDFNMTPPTLPDLVVDSVTPLNTTITQGAETRTQVVVANEGGDTVTGTFQVALFLDEAFTVGTVGLMGTGDVTDDLAPGGNATVVIIWNVPVDTDVGANHFVRAEVDWMRAIEELDDSNNNGTYDGITVVPRPLPDLTVPSVSPDGPTVKRESRVTFNITVTNSGTKATSGNTTLLIKDVTHNESIDSLNVPVLAVDETVYLEYEWYVDVPTLGSVTLHFLVDPFNNIEEEDEFDNYKDTVVTVQEADLPDLAIGADDVTYTPSVPRVGEAVSISITVHNLGTAGTDENVVVAVRLGNNRILQTDLLPLGAGEERTLDLVWPANEIQTPLTYPLIHTVDPDNTLRELDESNNEVTVNITFVNPPAPALENLVFDSSAVKVEDGGKVTLTVSIDNTGDDADLVSIEIKDGIETVASKQGITVAAGGSKTETFQVQLKGTGDHTLEVTILRGTVVAQDPSGSDLVDSVTVKVTEKPDDGGGIGLVVIIVIIVILVIVGIAVFLLMGRK